MFDQSSRYYSLEDARLTTVDQDGTTHQISYKRRRFIPQNNPNATTLVEYSVAQDERLDNITARYLGDPTQFWRLADANEARDPSELTAEPGRVIEITVPQM